MLSPQSTKYTETHPFAGVVLSVFDNGGATYFSRRYMQPRGRHFYTQTAMFVHVEMSFSYHY